MKIIIAPDSFKGSLSAGRAAKAMERGVRFAAAKKNLPVEILKIPMADGGEGTVEAIVTGVGGKIHPVTVVDPLGRRIEAFFGILPDNTGVIEMAAASGLNLIESRLRNPLITTTYGTGQLIMAALEAGCRKLIIGIGGSATNDGGVGMAQALGVKFLDKRNKPVGFGGGELIKIRKIDLAGLDPRVRDTTIIVASDVKNALCGPNGAAAVYGPQKGATPKMITVLDRNLKHLADLIQSELGKEIAEVPGSGAAGGLGGGLMAFLDAKIQSGIKIVMDLTRFAEKVQEADCVVTGEGATDFQTIFGKVPFGVAQIAKNYKKPVFCISGTLGKNYEELHEYGITAFFSIVDKPMTLDEAMSRGEELLEKITANVFHIYFLGG